MPAIIELKDQLELVPTKNYPYATWPFENFNPVQSRLFEYYKEDMNMIIATSTSSGKTVCSEILMADDIRRNKGKCIFLVPLRALAQEKIDDWTDSNYHFKDLKVAICTGDYKLTKERQEELTNADIIIMSTEMFAHKTRCYKSEKNDFLKNITTLICDEVHLLGVPGRGTALEVGLMKFAKINPNSRIIGLSATIPNVNEMAEWFSDALNHKQTYVIKSQYRPCKLNVHYETYEDYTRNYDVLENLKVNAALSIIEDYPEDKFLVFAHTKKIGELMKASLKKLGIYSEFHNANLDKKDRIKIQDDFKNDKNLRVIIATSTLAWGCYALGTPVLMADGKLKNIEDVVVGDFVASMNEGELTPQKVLKTGFKKPKKSLKFILESGEEVIVSEDHRFYGTVLRNDLDYYEAKHFKKGDFLTVPSSFKIFDKVKSDDFAYLCGYFYGDGCLCKAGKHADGKDKILMDICFGSHEKNHLQYVDQLFQTNLNYKFESIYVDSNKHLHLQTKKRDLVDKFMFIEPGRNKHKFTLNKFKYDLTPEYLRGFIQGLFDSDGGFSSHKNGNYSIEYTTCSKLLAHEIQQYLLYFGIRSTIGAKKVKKSIINGRLQIPRRKFIYRVRIYNNDILNFIEQIGFRNQIKINKSKWFVKNYKKRMNKDFIPARQMLIDHASANNISASKMLKSHKIDLWNKIHKNELHRSTCEKILQNYKNDSALTYLCNNDIRFSRIKSIEVVKNCKMKDIEVEGTHNYIGGGIISHNCNLPSRRVIILGCHRGLEEVATYDIGQMIGRAGRPAYDPAGDAYILVPDSKKDIYKNKYSKQDNIKSQLLENNQTGKYKNLAFHIVSEIYHGDINTKEGIYDWYRKSLANFQDHDMKEDVLEITIDSLKKCGAIMEDEDGNYVANSTGMISSIFYYSPYDVADLRKNFNELFNGGNCKDDLEVAMALANTDTFKEGIISKAEKEEMAAFAGLVMKRYGARKYFDQIIKVGFCYHNLMNGNNSFSCANTMRNLQADFPRVMQVIQTIDSMSAKWNKKEFLNQIEQRIQYGVKPELLDLVKIPDIGKARAKKLYESGIKTIKDFVGTDINNLKKIVNLKIEKVVAIVDEAKKLT